MRYTIVIELSKDEIEILKGLYPNDADLFTGYLSIDYFSRKEAKKIITKLRHLGLVQYRKGLMTEDGEVAGSGFARTREGDQIIKFIDEGQ